MQQRYFTITKNNATPKFYNGKWKVNYPEEFITSPLQTKRIELLNFMYFNDKGQLDIGTSCHASFNLDAVENDQMICFCCYGNSIQKAFEIRSLTHTFDIWFKDYKGVTVFPVASEEYFIIELNLIF